MNKKIALVTGGAQRIGAAICQALSQNYHILLHYHHSKTDAELVINKIISQGGSGMTLQADLSNEKGVEELLDQLKQHNLSIDLLINNASTFNKNTITDCQFETLMCDMHVHLYAPMALIQHMARHQKNGHIINVLDRVITTIRSNECSYWLSKKALENLTQLAAKTLAPGFRVNAIAPGFILPPIDADHAHWDCSEKVREVPLQKQGTTQDIVNAIISLESQPYLTGQILYVAGGKQLA